MTHPGPTVTMKRISLSIATVTAAKFQRREIASFLSANSRRLLDILPLGSGFTDTDPKEWKSRPDYQAAVSYVQSLNVTNDFAERGVALMQDFNSALTKDEDQKQYLLQVVEKHRKKFPNTNNATVTA